MKSKGLKTKEKIMQAAIHLLYTKGYEGVTFAKIANLAGLTQPAIYNYFNNKMDILAACAQLSVSIGLEYIQKNIDPVAPPSKQLTQYITNNFVWFSKEKELGHSILSAYYFSNNSAEIDHLREQVEGAGIQRISQFIIQGSHANEWSSDNYKTKAQFAHSIMVGETFKIQYQPNFKVNKPYLNNIINTIFKIIKD